MNFASILIINTYSITILAFIMIYTLKSSERKTLQYKLFLIMLQAATTMLVLDIFSRFDGNKYAIYSPINHVSNFLVFIFNFVFPSLWLVYVHNQVYRNKKRLRRLIVPLIIFNCINAILVIISQFTGWFYYIDSMNIFTEAYYFGCLPPLPLGLYLLL